MKLYTVPLSQKKRYDTSKSFRANPPFKKRRIVNLVKSPSLNLKNEHAYMKHTELKKGINLPNEITSSERPSFLDDKEVPDPPELRRVGGESTMFNKYTEDMHSLETVALSLGRLQVASTGNSSSIVLAKQNRREEFDAIQKEVKNRHENCIIHGKPAANPLSMSKSFAKRRLSLTKLATPFVNDGQDSIDYGIEPNELVTGELLPTPRELQVARSFDSQQFSVRQENREQNIEAHRQVLTSCKEDNDASNSFVKPSHRDTDCPFEQWNHCVEEKTLFHKTFTPQIDFVTGVSLLPEPDESQDNSTALTITSQYIKNKQLKFPEQVCSQDNIPTPVDLKQPGEESTIAGESGEVVSNSKEAKMPVDVKKAPENLWNHNANTFNKHRVVPTPYGLAMLLVPNENVSVEEYAEYSAVIPNPYTITKSKCKHWSNAEDELLKFAIQKQTGTSYNWKKIANTYFPGSRNGAQCKGRWTKINPANKQAPFSAEEDKTIVSSKVEGLTWTAIANKLPGRSREQIRNRFKNALDPTLKKNVPWSKEEDRILQMMQSQLGNRWTEISKQLPGRSENDVKNRWHNARMKETRRMKHLLSENNRKMKVAKRRSPSNVPNVPAAASLPEQSATIESNCLQIKTEAV